jgi:hypothetical protein
LYKRILTILILFVLAIILVCPAVDSDDAVSTGQHEHQLVGLVLGAIMHDEPSIMNLIEIGGSTPALPKSTSASMRC